MSTCTGLVNAIVPFNLTFYDERSIRDVRLRFGAFGLLVSDLHGKKQHENGPFMDVTLQWRTDKCFSHDWTSRIKKENVP